MNRNYNSKIKRTLTKNFLSREYILKQRTIKQISQRVGCNKVTVSSYLKKFNIPTRKTIFSKDFNPSFKRDMSGEYNPNWQGGIHITSDGYRLLWKPGHPFSNKYGYVPEHRLVIEDIIGRYLKPVEIVHHKGIKYPIDSFENKQHNKEENLILFPNWSEHIKYHRRLEKND